MSGIRKMQHGLQAIKDGNLDEGARLLRIALLDATLTPAMRAVVYVSLADTDSNPTFKMQCYNEALSLDPNNVQARQRLEALMTNSSPGIPLNPAQPLIVTPLTTPADAAPPTLMSPPTPPPTPPSMTPPTAPPLAPPPPPAALASPVAVSIDPSRQAPTHYHTVGILDGPNGLGTGFFITQDGIVATTRHVVGGLENVTISLNGNRQVIGKVIRSYSDIDLALVRVEIHMAQVSPMTNTGRLPDNTEISAGSFHGGPIRGRIRATRRDLKPYWIPTTIRELPDIGGGPVFDDRNVLIGMLTANASRLSADVYALHVHEILNRLNEYRQALLVDPQRTYCPSCGYTSRAPNYNAFYCEQCGSVLPNSRGINRYPIPHMAALYGENTQRPCRVCGSAVGFYNGQCLRCGSDY